MNDTIYQASVAATAVDKNGNKRKVALIYNINDNWPTDSGSLHYGFMYNGLSSMLEQDKEIVGYQGDYYELVNNLWVKKSSFYPVLAG